LTPKKLKIRRNDIEEFIADFDAQVRKVK